MGEDIRGQRDSLEWRHDSPMDGGPVKETVVAPSRGSGVVFVLVALALVLAIGFFYLTGERREDRRADALTRAAGSADSAAQVVGDAARNAAEALQNDN